MKVLLVDDEQELIGTLADRLRLRGIEAECANSGKMAVMMARDKAFDAAVIDMKMAGMNGIETMIQVRERAPDMKFIILTGHGDEDDYHRGRAAGVSSYLMKPIDIELLIAKIKEALAGGTIK